MGIHPHALSYISRGWAVVPIPPRKKGPVIGDWIKLRLTDDEVPRRFRANDNVGVILGEASGDLVDIDLDCDEAIALAIAHLPPTLTFGRESKRQSHWLYTVPSPGSVRRLCDPVTGDVILEYRANGGQTVFPGSVHESGEPIEWDGDGTVPPAECPTLLSIVGQLAAAVMAQRYGDDMPPEAVTKVREWTGQPAAPPVRLKPAKIPHADVHERARRYLASIPGAVSGSSGHRATFKAALALVKGFSLAPSDALRLLSSDYNQRCDPPWDERDLEHKVESASRSHIAEGYLLARERPGVGPPELSGVQSVVDPEEESRVVTTIRKRVAAKPEDAFSRDVLDMAAGLSPVEYHRIGFILKRSGVPVGEWRKEVKRVKDSASELSASGDPHPRGLDFEVQTFEIELSDPPIYHVTIDGQRLTMEPAVLLSPLRFKQLFVEKMRRVPRMPGSRKGERPWDDYVNEWLVSAKEIAQSPEASRSFSLKVQIAAHVDNMIVSEDPGEMDAGKVYLHRGSKAFKKGPVIAAIRSAGQTQLQDNQFCSLLRELGCKSTSIRVAKDKPGSGVHRTWVAPEVWTVTPSDDDADEEAQETTREPGSDDE